MKLLILSFLFSTLGHAQNAPFYSETIYDTDDRQNISQIKNKELAQPIVVAISHRYARLNPFINTPTLASRYRLCSEVAFAQEPSIGDCTGTHIGSGIVMTAQHCVQNKYDCEKLSWAFDYTDEFIHQPLSLPHLYQCESILAQDAELDVTLLKLKDGKHMPKQKIDLSLGSSDWVFAIGSPMGLPLKHSGLGAALPESSTHLVAAIDVFQGNSGSPVFNIEEKMIGMLVSGGRDLEKDEMGCLKNYVTSSATPLERVVLLQSLPENMKKIIQRAQRSR